MVDQPPYVCWEEHREDLTQQVEAELENPGRLSIYYRRREQATDQRYAKVFATCSQGHLNSFEVELPEN